MKVYTYESIERPSRHCREEVAVDLGAGRLVDTFWDLGSETHTLTEAERATTVFVFDTDDYDELDRHGRESEARWATYAPADREVITSQHGLRFRWFVRKGAAPDLATQIENAERDVEAREGDLRSAQWALDWAREKLAELRSDPASVVGKQSDA